MTPEWNQTDMRNLLELWDKGRSTAEIGRRVGVTKNAVVGKAQESNCRLAHRLFGRQIRCCLTRTAAEIGHQPMGSWD
ncbi:MAG: GcrA family cell cycle regulator [Acetobacteraceae bacterium]|jgi:GcrA cell cycle regulator